MNAGCHILNVCLLFESTIFSRVCCLFVPAGNGGDTSYLYPASYPSVLSVAALDSNNNKASFSQYNDQVEIAGESSCI